MMTKHECDETCHGCPKCYLATGQTVCDKACQHAIVEDELDKSWVMLTREEKSIPEWDLDKSILSFIKVFNEENRLLLYTAEYLQSLRVRGWKGTEKVPAANIVSEFNYPSKVGIISGLSEK